MAVRGHGDQVTAFPLGGGGDLGGWVAASEHGVGIEPLGREAGTDLLQVVPVVAHLFRLTQVELADVAGHPAVRHVDQDERRAHAPGEHAHVREDGLVGGGMLEWDEDAAVHHRSQAPNACTITRALRAAITTATP